MSWKDITIKKYIALHKAMQDKYDPTEDYDSVELKAFAILSIIHDKPQAYFENIPVNELAKLINDMQFIYATPKSKGVPFMLRIGLKRYELERMPSNLNSGQYIDLSKYCKDENTINNNFHKIIATISSPHDFFGNRFKRMLKKAKTQDEIEIVNVRIWEERQKIAKELLDKLTMDKVFQISSYFFLLWQNLTVVIGDCSVREMKKAVKNLNQVLSEEGFENIGVG